MHLHETKTCEKEHEYNYKTMSTSSLQKKIQETIKLKTHKTQDTLNALYMCLYAKIDIVKIVNE